MQKRVKPIKKLADWRLTQLSQRVTSTCPEQKTQRKENISTKDATGM